MDEFDKIKELSDDIIKRKEPVFDSDTPEKSAPLPDLSIEKESEFSDEAFDKKTFSSFKGHLIALSFFISILTVILTCVFIFGDDNQPDDIITITATPNPVKIKPDEQNTPSAEAKQIVYNRSRDIPSKIEKLFPEPEKPILPEIMSEDSEIAENKNVKQPDTSFIIEEIVPQAKHSDRPAEKIKTDLSKETVQPVSKGGKPDHIDKKQPKKMEEFWRVQLLSTSKKGAAEKAWSEISKKQKALLSDMSHEIVSANIAGKGTFYRLQVGRFKTRDQAAALCSKLKTKRQECVPVKGVSDK